MDFHVEPGEAVRIVGPNGSGKTTLLRRLAGLPVHAPMEAEVDGQDPAALPAELAAARIGYLPQDARDALVGLTIGGEFRFRGLEAPGDLDPHQDVATTSTGEARRMALRFTPGKRLLLLDEPTEGLDERAMALVQDRILEGKRDGAVVFVDHGHRLAAFADRTVRLGDATPHIPIAWPLPPEGRHLQVARATAVLGDRSLDLPGLHVGPGVHAITGANGSGKSTLLRRIAGLLGEPGLLDGTPLHPGRDVRWLGPQPRDQLGGERVRDLVQAGALVEDHLLDRHPLTLSGGEARRVALARTLGGDAAVYLLDEPEAHLDGAGRNAMLTAVAARVADGAIVVMATHDEDLIAAAHSRTRCG